MAISNHKEKKIKLAVRGNHKIFSIITIEDNFLFMIYVTSNIMAEWADWILKYNNINIES